MVRNYNPLLGRYPGTDGMKTGFICASGFNLVATATRDNKQLIAVVLGASSGAARAVKAAEMLESGFRQNPLSWLIPSLGTVDQLKPIEAAPPNLKDEMCGPHRKRMQQAESDDEGLDATGADGNGDAATPHPKFSVLLSALRAPTAKNVNLLSDGGPVVPIVVYTGPTRPPGWKPACGDGAQAGRRGRQAGEAQARQAGSPLQAGGGGRQAGRQAEARAITAAGSSARNPSFKIGIRARENSMNGKMTISALQQMKRDGKKSIGVVAWDYQIARIADRAGVDFVSVGDSVGVNLWGRSEVAEVTMDEMLICCKAVRAGVERALVSCDMPYGPVQEGVQAAITAAILLMQEGGADMIKVDAAAEFPNTVRAMVAAGIPVFAQFGLTPQTAIKYGIPYSAQNSPQAQAGAEAAEKLVAEAKLLEDAGAACLDFTNSGPVAGAAVVEGGENSGDRRLRRRAVARRPRSACPHRDRLRGKVDRLQDRHLRQHRQSRARRLHGADRRRARRAADQGLANADRVIDGIARRYTSPSDLT